MARSTLLLSTQRLARPDAILLGAPLVFLGTFCLSRWLGNSTPFAIAIASIVCLAPILDGVFRNPPVQSSGSD
ncbi:MAG: hypothetical protein ABEI98_02805 [Halorhabdus sp.]